MRILSPRREVGKNISPKRALRKRARKVSPLKESSHLTIKSGAELCLDASSERITVADTSEAAVGERNMEVVVVKSAEVVPQSIPKSQDSSNN